MIVTIRGIMITIILAQIGLFNATMIDMKIRVNLPHNLLIDTTTHASARLRLSLAVLHRRAKTIPLSAHRVQADRTRLAAQQRLVGVIRHRLAEALRPHVAVSLRLAQVVAAACVVVDDKTSSDAGSPVPFT